MAGTTRSKSHFEKDHASTLLRLEDERRKILAIGRKLRQSVAKIDDPVLRAEIKQELMDLAEVLGRIIPRDRVEWW
jgi:hypothetical protein